MIHLFMFVAKKILKFFKRKKAWKEITSALGMGIVSAKIRLILPELAL